MLATSNFYALACVLMPVFAVLAWLIRAYPCRFKQGADSVRMGRASRGKASRVFSNYGMSLKG